MSRHLTPELVIKSRIVYIVIMDNHTLYLILYVAIALGFSFLCSIWEAAFLSTSFSHIELLVKRGKRSGYIMRQQKQNVEDGISAILTLNTIAHTVGAAGAGAEAALIFGNQWIGLISAILTLLILVFSEIIPKTLGARYWKQLTPFTAYGIKILVLVLYPVVWASRQLGRLLTPKKIEPTISRAELEILAQIGAGEGVLRQEEHRILENLLHLNRVAVSDIMTPRTVVFMLKATATIQETMAEPEFLAYSRIPVYENDLDDIKGYVLRQDVLSAASGEQSNVQIGQIARPLHAVPETMTVSRVLRELTKRQEHIFLVIDEYGGTAGIVTLEDALESLLGTEITDETDLVTDLRKLAEKRHARRFKKLIQASQPQSNRDQEDPN